ncbi:MAG: GAF domain-containing protein [Chloroflexi bacterium]|nr:GAF domain-containing protein [Chloroflexota bacterium]
MKQNEVTIPTFDLIEWREQFIRIVLRIASILGVILIAASFATASLTDRILFVSLYLILLSITLLPAPYMLRAYLLLSMVTTVGVNAIFAWGPWADGSIFLLTAITLAALLLDNRTDTILLASSIIFLSVMSYLTLNGVYRLTAPDVPELSLPTWAVYTIDFAIAGIIIVTATNMLKSAFAGVVNQIQSAVWALDQERETLEAKVQDRTAELETRMGQLRASTTTARAIAESQEISELLNKAVALISERFEYYHVAIFIMDAPRQIAFLQAASSETGKKQIGQSFRIERDRKKPLAVVAETRKTLITHDLDRANFVQDANYPLTRSRMVMPLAVRGHLIGILDIHSDQPRAFNEQDAEVLQALADLTAISFDNVRLLNETRTLLSQLEANTSLQTQRTWSKFTSRHKSAFQYTPAGVRPLFEHENREQKNGLLIPIKLHGQSIGNIRLQKRKGTSNEWTERERDLAEKISSQVALALENSRLVDEAQKNAMRNQMIANFSTYVRETLDIEAVIKTAATELRKVFDLKEAEIMIGAAPNKEDA